MVDFFANLNPVVQALIATLFTWAMTGLGAAAVFLFKELKRSILDGMLGFAAGVMLAASFWSLLEPAIELSGATELPSWLPAVAGFLAGGAVLRIADRVLPHLHLGYPKDAAEGVKTSWHRITLLVVAITLHNIPEGLAAGVAFGAIAADLPAATLASAVVLAVGLGIQNLPEGMAVSMPLRSEGLSRRGSFFVGQLSGVVEPIFGVIGAAAVILVQALLPYALSFAAGAMTFVVIEDVLPESQRSGNIDIATAGAMIGFTVMMFLDVSLG